MGFRIAFVLLLAATALRAQSVAGVVQDSATRAPIARANVSILSGTSALASARTDDSGRFQIAVPKPGAYTLRIQLIGYRPYARGIQLDGGATVRATYTIARIPLSLDTVVTSGRVSLFNVTPGRAKYAEHMKQNLGQMVSGLEIQRSKMSLLEYLGMLPGLRYRPGAPSVISARMATSAPPLLPGRNGYLVGESGKCLYGRIDHWAVAYLLYTQSVENIEDLVSVDDIMGVEVFAFDEVPKEWRFDASPSQILWRHSAGPGSTGYVLGNGTPSITHGMLMEMPSFRSQRPGSGPDTLRIDTLLVTPPRCGFVQIWTRISW